MGWWNNITDFFGWEWVRARDDKGRFIADDKSTPNVDESKKKVYKKRAPKKVEVNYPLDVPSDESDLKDFKPVKTKNYRKAKPKTKKTK
jgi:hypothetical protein|tara:strand:- start:333 stop:599 length:267 start_codon:yes stop_codon:yes gene_type:complete